MIKRWLKLWQLAKRRLQSREDYRAFQQYQGRWVAETLERRGIRLKGARVLDLGCGVGGYSLALTDFGAEVIGLDIRPPVELTSQGIAQVAADALRLPFRESTFDGIFCASLIEHVPDPYRLLVEIRRVIRGGGWVYLSFPPFFSPLGGHQFSPFHYFGEKVALAIGRHQRWWGSSDWVPTHFDVRPTSFSDAFGLYGLYPITIKKVRSLVEQTGFQVRHYGPRFMSANLANIPILGEVLTWHVEFILET